jgi:hypothetical protein
MKKFALLAAAVVTLGAGPALAQAGGGATPAPPGGGSNTGGGAADRLAMPDRETGVNAQQMMDREGDLDRGYGKGARRAQAYHDKLEAFSTQSAPRRTEALAIRDAARGAGLPANLSAKVIRDALAQDMEDWRKEFKIGRAEYEALRNEILVEESALSPTQWADRRAQWFEVRDAWIGQELQQAIAQGAQGGANTGG